MKIIYIAGLGHSGSTILDMSLGCSQRVVGLGAGIVGGNISCIDDMANALTHRGPDNLGVVILEKENIALAHTRLAIIDLDPRSNQPFKSHCGRYLLTYNGEIYNYIELKADLENKGYKFETNSDTEVLLYSLIDSGVDCLNLLDGMFAFCFLDKEKGNAILARDAIGEKPLYFAEGMNGQFAFASEIGPLINLEWIDRRLKYFFLRFIINGGSNFLNALTSRGLLTPVLTL